MVKALTFSGLKVLVPVLALFYDGDGMLHHFVSGQDADADNSLTVGREAGVFPKVGAPIVVDHVEVKVAAAMRKADVRMDTLVINNPGGPCRVREGRVEPQSCLAFLPRLLPAGAELIVWWPDPNGGAARSQTFVGGQR